MSDPNKTEGREPVGSSELLDARNAALQKIILVECENEKEKGNIRAMLLMLLREAAGAGFDEGVRFMASNDKGQR